MKKLKYVFLVAIVLSIVCFLSYNSFLASFEGYIEDAMLQSPGTADTRIIILAIDDQSLSEIGQFPWHRSVYAKLINKLNEAKPAVIGIDIMFPERSQYPEDDKAFVEAVKNAGNVVVPVYGNFDAGQTKHGEAEATEVSKPFSELDKAAITGHINVMADDSDGVIRKYIDTFSYKGKEIKSFDRTIYEEFLKNTGDKSKINIPKDRDGRSRIQFISTPGDFDSRPNAYTIFPLSKVLDGEIDPEYFRDQIVLIGPYTLGIAKDQYITPLDHSRPMYGIEIHANILQNLMYNKFKVDAPNVINIFNILLIGLSCLILFKKLKPVKSAIIAVAIIIIYILVVKFVYNKGYILHILYPVLIVIISYVIAIGYRYIDEMLERKRITNVFGRYVAPQVVSEILKGGEEGLKLGGVRREITAMFVDIRGFTTLSEKIQPEEVVGILNDYLNLCAESIFKFEGTLDKFIGDAAMAIFNAPLDLENHPFKAVQTAWAIKHGSEVLRADLEGKFGRSVQFGIGINTGYAVVGNIGSKARMDYTAIGDTVNTAARLESNAKPGQILLSQDTYERVKDMIEASYLGEIKVKGKEQGVPVYQLDGLI